MNIYRKFNIGDMPPKSAARETAISEMLQAFKRSQKSNTTNSAKGTREEFVLIENNSGVDVEPHQILGIDGVLFDPPGEGATPEETAFWESEFEFHYSMKGVLPDVLFHLGKFAITLDFIPIGKIGRAIMFGVSPVKLEVVNEGHLWADVTNGNVTKLTTSDNGSARILWKESGTGEKWGIVRIGDKPRGLFPVHVAKDGGADGDGTTAATWTYTVTTLLGDALGTAVNVIRPRPKGSMIFQTDGYGVGFFDGPTFYLWDAGEVENTFECGS